MLLSGCSQQFQDVNSTFSEFWSGTDDVILSTSDINSIPYASAYAEFNEQGQIFMVLAFAESNPTTGVEQLKWMSSDRVMVVTENGRIVQTLKLPYENLVSMDNGAPNPYDLWGRESQTWQSRYDWQPDYRFGYSAEITRRYIKDEVVTTPINEFNTQKYIEETYFPTLEQTIENQFWVDESGKVVKSVQFLGPEMTKVEFTILKEFKG